MSVTASSLLKLWWMEPTSLTTQEPGPKLRSL
jgi:hypothetical protein